MKSWIPDWEAPEYLYIASLWRDGVDHRVELRVVDGPAPGMGAVVKYHLDRLLRPLAPAAGETITYFLVDDRFPCGVAHEISFDG